MPDNNNASDGKTIDIAAVNTFWEEKYDKSVKDIRDDLERQLSMYKNVIALALFVGSVLVSLAGFLGYSSLKENVRAQTGEYLTKNVSTFTESIVTRQLSDTKVRDLVVNLTAQKLEPDVRDRLVGSLGKTFVMKNSAYWVKTGLAPAGTGWYLDVSGANLSQGRMVDIAIQQPSQTWIISDH